MDFPRTVGPDDSGALPGRDAPLDVPQHRTSVERHRHAEQVDDVFSQPGGGQLGQFDGVAQRRYVGDQLVGGLDPEFGFRRPRRGAATQPGQFLAHQVLSLGLRGGRLPVPLDPLQDIRGVPALERFDDAVVHLPSGGGDFVEKPAVVGDHQ
ncbi:hypothetical protein IWGMT90018_32250 [Mycobacterium kiyosense]|nr:hypothetical protein IWGMT90018_32250 [Mycobacterium kiyosense]